MKTVGLIGLGAMGGSYAKHLLTNGYQVFGVDPDKNNRNSFSSLGGLILNNINDLTKKCKIVILSLPTVPIFKDVIKEIEIEKKEYLIVPQSAILILIRDDIDKIVS